MQPITYPATFNPASSPIPVIEIQSSCCINLATMPKSKRDSPSAIAIAQLPAKTCFLCNDDGRFDVIPAMQANPSNHSPLATGLNLFNCWT